MIHNKYKKQPIILGIKVHQVEWTSVDKGLGLKVKTPRQVVEIQLQTGETLQGSVDLFPDDNIKKARASAAAQLLAQAIEAIILKAED